MLELLPTSHLVPMAPPGAGPALNPNRAPEAARALDRVRGARTILEGLREAPSLAAAAAADARRGSRPGRLVATLLDAVADGADSLAGLAAIHALSAVPGDQAGEALGSLLVSPGPGHGEHAAWALYRRAPTPSLFLPLAGQVTRGGLAGMHAQHVLAAWAIGAPGPIVGALVDELAQVGHGPSRRYLVETIGLIAGPEAADALVRIVMDGSEIEAVRRSAIAAFGERIAAPLPALLGELAGHDGPLAEAVRLARVDRQLLRRGPWREAARRDRLRIAQLHLGAVLEADGSRAGIGEVGGVATLLPRLGAELVRVPYVEDVLTIGRARTPSDAGRERGVGRHRFEGVHLEPGEGATFTGSWPSVVDAGRGIARALLATGTPDVIHLRVADPGSLAGARVARRLRIPVVFTLAPDPHGPIDALERVGELDRRSFAAADARSHLWYRTGLVAHLEQVARHVVLFPRLRSHQQLRELVGVDITADPARYTTVAEGVDTDRAAGARARVAARRDPPNGSALADLLAQLARLPAERQGLPLVVTVGRLVEAKGMARLVAAFDADADLAARATLVVVGGDLVDPSADEAAELARIGATVAGRPGLRDAVLLLGHRPNGEVCDLLAAAHRGVGGVIGARGAYACASLKEEFGLAILEALAAGLPVVAPEHGGPATYVEDGRTGLLVDTMDPRALAMGISSALLLSRQEGTSDRARATVDGRYTMAAMAGSLAAVYGAAAMPRGRAAKVSPPAAA